MKRVFVNEIDIFHFNYQKKTLKRSFGAVLSLFANSVDVLRNDLQFLLGMVALWFSGKFFIAVM
jgi:hypothetical protein